METRVAVLGIIVENTESTEELNSLLHDYGQYIIGRMGIPYREKKINIISGPTNTQQYAFNWKNTTCDVGHVEFTHNGQPDEWNFPWVVYTTELFE